MGTGDGGQGRCGDGKLLNGKSSAWSGVGSGDWGGREGGETLTRKMHSEEVSKQAVGSEFIGYNGWRWRRGGPLIECLERRGVGSEGGVPQNMEPFSSVNHDAMNDTWTGEGIPFTSRKALHRASS